MKTLALNASPWMHKGNTALILDPFLEGMRKAGAEVELFYTKKLNINPCQGEFHCWTKVPGECFQKDDMGMILSKTRETDVLVLATPVYVDGMSGPLKNLLDRLIPLIQPIFEMRDGHCRHPVREGHKHGQVVLVSNCGFWEMDNFDPLIAHVKAFCKNAAMEYAGALLRPHGPALKPMMKMGLPVDDVLQAAQAAGRQLVEEGQLSPETLATVSRNLLPLETYIQHTNQRFEEVLAKLN